MDFLLIITYAAICIGIFKLFKIPVNAITLLTAVLGGVFLIGFLLLGMNYNHPYSSNGRFYYVTTPIVPAVSGKVIDSADIANLVEASLDGWLTAGRFAREFE